MAIICPTVTAFGLDDYRKQVRLLQGFAKRIHIDLMDGEFAPTTSPAPEQLEPIDGLVVDLHVMYRRPMEHLDAMLALKPNLVVIHQEAEVDHAAFAKALHEAGVKAGIAVLQQTPVAAAKDVVQDFDHFLIFSGNLGHHGGSTADLGLLEKAKQALELKGSLELGWDGGINDENALILAHGHIGILNTGGFIHEASDPAAAFNRLQQLVS